MRSIIQDNKTIYVLVHMEAAFCSLNLFSVTTVFQEQDEKVCKSKGIYIRHLNQNTVSSIQMGLKNVKKSVINFDMNHIREIDDRSVSQEMISMLIDLIERNNSINFINVDDDLSNDLLDIIEALSKSEKKVNGTKSHKDPSIFKKSSNDTMVQEIYSKEKSLINARIENIIENSCEKLPDDGELSPSSRVKLTKYVNLKAIMTNPDSIAFLCYVLAQKLSGVFLDSVNPEKNRHKRFLVHTINGAIFGGVLCRLFSISMNKIDHLGPRNQLFLEDSSSIIKNKIDYITISDVICMGREISDAKTTLKLLHANYCVSAAIVNINPINTPNNEIVSAIEISKMNNFIDYKIITDL